MKVAYWPGCVSRGFTPELHGSMAAVAPLLDIELVDVVLEAAPADPKTYGYPADQSAGTSTSTSSGGRPGRSPPG